MPSRNVTKEQAPDSYYHVYVRGINKQNLFNSEGDYRYYIDLLERYFSDVELVSKSGAVYPGFLGKVEILSYCLMSNHFHLLVYQIDVPYLEKFMRSLMTSYSRYLNLKNKRTGSVFESRYKAVRIANDRYLQHISRYIHLNPQRWEHYKYSSLKYYRDGNAPHWLNTDRILEQFSSKQDYIGFIYDYQEMHDTLSELKHQLADYY
jgi:REP element-mobilizing transposase RayT